jgi:hypothetical protein
MHASAQKFVEKLPKISIKHGSFVHTYIHTYAYRHLNTNMHRYILMYMSMHSTQTLLVCTYTCAHAHVNTYVRIPSYTWRYMWYTHTHTPPHLYEGILAMSPCVYILFVKSAHSQPTRCIDDDRFVHPQRDWTGASTPHMRDRLILTSPSNEITMCDCTCCHSTVEDS